MGGGGGRGNSCSNYREALTIVLPNCGISAVGKRARLLGTQATYIVLISAECVCTRSDRRMIDQRSINERRVCLLGFK